MEISNLSLGEGSSKESTIYFYTGTSYMNSSAAKSKAAVCICVNEDENDTMIELLGDELSTSQKVELHGIYRALSIIREEQNVVIISRSEYAVKCVTEWSIKWRQDDWKKVPKASAQNINIIEDILELLEQLVENKKSVQIWHSSQVPNKQGNQVAQKLARQTLLKYN